MENEDVDIPTIEQGTTNDNQTPTFQDTLNNYDQLLINRKGSLKPDRYSLIDEIKEGNIGGALNQSIDQFFQNKWEGLGPENQDLILQGIDTIQKGKELTKSNWKKYPVESSLWHAIDFIGSVAGPIYQAGTTVTANVGERGFGINRELIEKANTINQIRTGKVFPFLPNRIPGVNLRPRDIGISSKIEKITPLPPKDTKRMFNITKDVTEILQTAPASYLRKVSAIYKHHEGGITWKQAMAMAKLPNRSSSIHLYKDSEVSIEKGGLFDPDRQEPTEMYSTGVDPVESDMDKIKRKVIKDNLESDPVNEFLLGNTTKLPKQHRTLIQNSALGEVTDADFKGTSGVSVPLRPGYIPTTEAYTNYIGRLDQLIEEFPNLKNKFEGLKGSFLWNEHHLNPRTAPLDFYVGRTNVAERNVIRDQLVDEFNIFSGNSPLNRIGLPTGLEEADVHSMVHKWLAPRLGERSDVLKAKWAKEAGLNLGPLQTRQGGRPGYLAGQQYLSDADRVTWNNYMSQLPVDGKLMKRYIREYGTIIKESEALIERLMKQFDAFYRVPKSYQVEVTPDDLVAVLDNIDPTKEISLPLIERTIREVLEDKKLNLINPETKEIVGVVQKSEKELNMLFRADDLMSMLDAANKPGWTGTVRQITSWAKELNEIYTELGLLPKGQLSFNIKGGKLSAYLQKMKKARFGNTTLSDIDKPIKTDKQIQDIMNEVWPDE